MGGIPNIILIGAKSKEHLLRIEKHLAENSIDHIAWEEPDFDFGLTALATVPLTHEQKKSLSNYHLWYFPCLGSSEKERTVLTGGSVV